MTAPGHEFIDLKVAPEPAAGVELFRSWSLRELFAEDLEFTWAMRGLLVHPTYGPIGGEKKTLKTYVGIFLDLALVSGIKLFGQFAVPEARPVVAYVGEGGRKPWTRRVGRIAQAMGINRADLLDLPLHPSFDVAPIGSPRFGESFRRDLDIYGPVLAHLDPMYAFHPPTTNASNLYERGEMLAGLSTASVNADASLLIADHFKKTGSGRGLDRITQAGMQEWSDTWLLLSHRQDPDVEHGLFWLTLEIGSRQWGGSQWDLDLDVGRFDQAAGEFDGAISWDLCRHAASASRTPTVALVDQVLDLIIASPRQLTKQQLVSACSGGSQGARDAIQALESAGRIAAVPTIRDEGGRSVKRNCYDLLGSPAAIQPRLQPGLAEQEALD